MFKVWLAKFSDKGGCFYTCSLSSATAVWLRDLLIIKFKPGGIVLNSICFSYRSFDTFMDDVWSMFTVSFRSFLTRNLFLRMSRVCCHRRLVPGFVGHELQTSESHFKHIYFSPRRFHGRCVLNFYSFILVE